VGIVVSTIISTALTSIIATQERPPRRLIVLPAGAVESGNMSFIKDTKTAPCWLMIRTRDDMGGPSL
jgi:hypothetical protein